MKTRNVICFFFLSWNDIPRVVWRSVCLYCRTGVQRFPEM